jgi:thymidine phosphorylase
VVEAPRAGVLAGVDTLELGLLLAQAGGGRAAGGTEVDFGVSLRYRGRLGREVAAGEELARLYLRRPDDGLVRRLAACFEVADAAAPPPLVHERIGAPRTSSDAG